MKKFCFVFQRACYLSLNPQKDETLETEKAQYTLPDGSTLDVRMRLLIYVSVWEYGHKITNHILVLLTLSGGLVQVLPEVNMKWRSELSIMWPIFLHWDKVEW